MNFCYFDVVMLFRVETLVIFIHSHSNKLIKSICKFLHLLNNQCFDKELRADRPIDDKIIIYMYVQNLL